MLDNFHEKGKIFTNVISKKTIPVIIQTLTVRIEGEVHVRPDNRLIDELNGSEPFLAITKAIVRNTQGETIHPRGGFIAVNKSQVVWIIPSDGL